jgi:subtilisin family serine protease
MSFGLGNENREVEGALQRASMHGVLLFAAASNGGINDQIGFPARLPGVIPIYAADGKGNASDFNPPPKQHDANFSVLGEAVPVSPLQKRQKQKWVSGTSFATPIAAAVAANILEFARQQQKEWLLNKDEMAHLHRSEGMMTVFKAMGRAQDGMNFLQPWTLFYPEKSLRRMTERIRSTLAESLGTSHAIGGDICETASVTGFSVTGVSDISGSTLEGDGPSSLEEAIALLLLEDPVLKPFFGPGLARSGFTTFQNHFSMILRLHASRLRRVARTELEKGFASLVSPPKSNLVVGYILHQLA